MRLRQRLRELVERAAPDAAVVECDDHVWRWSHLRQVTDGIDRLLARLGVPPGGRVAVPLENRPEAVAALVAILASDRCVVAINPLQSAASLATDLRSVAAAALVASDSVLDRLGVTPERPTIAIQGSGSLRLAVDGAAPVHTADDGIVIELTTSGTTGPPKRVPLTDRQLDAAIAAGAPDVFAGPLVRSGVAILANPLAHIGGLWTALTTVAAGRRLVLLERFDVDAWVAAVEAHRPRVAGLVPAALRSVLDADVPVARLRSLRALTTGAAPCPADIVDAFLDRYGIRVLTMYGATEFAGAIAGWDYDLHRRWWQRKRGSVGVPLPGVTLRVVDGRGRPVSPGEVGSIEVRCPQSPLGPSSWVRTSDLGRLDPDGFLWLEGRADDVIIRGGFKVHPRRVEQVLREHPAVLEAVVVGLPHDRLGAVPVAVVEQRAGTETVDREELIARCRARLAPYEVPIDVLVVDELPRTPSSKVRRPEVEGLVKSALGHLTTRPTSGPSR